MFKSRSEPFTGIRPVLPDGTLAKHFVWSTYAEIDVRRRRVGSALEVFRKSGELWNNGEELQTVGIWSGNRCVLRFKSRDCLWPSLRSFSNRPEWQVVDLALHAYGKVGVSLYDTLGPDSVEYMYVIHLHTLFFFFSRILHAVSTTPPFPSCSPLRPILPSSSQLLPNARASKLSCPLTK